METIHVESLLEFGDLMVTGTTRIYPLEAISFSVVRDDRGVGFFPVYVSPTDGHGYMLATRRNGYSSRSSALAAVGKAWDLALGEEGGRWMVDLAAQRAAAWESLGLAGSVEGADENLRP